MSKQYVHVFNFETKADQKKAKEFLNIMPTAKVEPYGIIGLKGHREWDKTWRSLWVPEELFFLAWTYFSYCALKDGYVSAQDGLDYFQMQINDNDFIMHI